MSEAKFRELIKRQADLDNRLGRPSFASEFLQRRKDALSQSREKGRSHDPSPDLLLRRPITGIKQP